MIREFVLRPHREEWKFDKESIENAVKKYQDSIMSKRSWGELGISDEMTISMDRVSHIIESLDVDGDHVKARIRILDTPMGMIVKSLNDQGIALKARLRSAGNVRKDGIITNIIIFSVDIHDQAV